MHGWEDAGQCTHVWQRLGRTPAWVYCETDSTAERLLDNDNDNIGFIMMIACVRRAFLRPNVV